MQHDSLHQWGFFFMQKSEGKAESTGDPVSFVEWLMRPKQQRYSIKAHHLE